MSQTASSAGLRELGRVMVPVSNQDRAIEFYVEKLGFELRADVPYGDGDRWVEVGLPGSRAQLALTPMRQEGWEPGRMTGISFSVDDAQATHQTLRSAGIDVDDYMPAAQGAPSMFFFRDGDGNTLHIVEQP